MFMCNKGHRDAESFRPFCVGCADAESHSDAESPKAYLRKNHSTYLKVKRAQ